MTDITSLYLISPIIEAPSEFTEALAAVCAVPEVAAVLLRLAPADERTQVNRLKILAPVAQEHDVAVMVTIEGQSAADIATIAARGGADGVHVDFEPELVADLTERLKGERSLGVGGLHSRDDAMRCGELGADYVMFGEPRPDGFIPPLETIAERAAWWAEIFETPCVVFAADMESIKVAALTGAEFVALGDAIWGAPEGPALAARKAVEIVTATIAERSEQ